MFTVVLDTNVLVAALRSRRGASFRLLQILETGSFRPIVSSPLCVEYEDVLSRQGLLPDFTVQEVQDFLDYLLSQSTECHIYFLWRPYLPDPKDDLVLETALAGGATMIVTHNRRHFEGIESLGIRAVTPDDFLTILRSTP